MVRKLTFRGIAWLLLTASFIVFFAGSGCGTAHTEASPAAAPPSAAVDLTFSQLSDSKSASGLKDSDLAHAVAAGTAVPIDLRSVVDSSAVKAGFVAGIVDSDIKGSDGRVAIPAGSGATLFVRSLGQKGRISELAIGLYAINILGHEYSFTTGPSDAASLVFTEDAGLGAGHRSVHLYYNQLLSFKLDRAVQLR